MQLSEQQIAEDKEIEKRFKALVKIHKPKLNDNDLDLIKKAFEVAKEAHREQRRKNGEPYIFHPIEVARIVTQEMGLGSTSVVCALLHDVVEDSDIRLKDIENWFGEKVAKIVDGLTKVREVFSKETKKEINKSEQAETFRKVILTISQDIRVILVKIADRLHNMRTLDSMSKEKQLKIVGETNFVYAPLAHRLGLYNIKSELDDLCLKYTNPKVYEDISQKIKLSEKARNKFIAEFIAPIEEALKNAGFTFEIKSRLKSIDSIHKKMIKQEIPFEEVMDIFAIRIIVQPRPGEEEKAACWNVYSVVTDYYLPNPNRLRDWISVPKSNGYESLHTTVMKSSEKRGTKGQWVEVQIRSFRMDEIAEKGLAAHWKYKGQSADKTEQGIEMWISKVREALENKNVSALEFVDDFRRNLFSDEVYVFTPKGDMITLPHGATVLDFAFEIHSEVGERCIGAKVSHRLVPLNYVLNNGDQVEIIKATHPKVNRSWLEIAQTSKARHKINQYIRREQIKTIKDGKEIIERKLGQLKMTANEHVIAQLVEFFNLKSANQLYLNVGTGKIDHTKIKKFKDAQKKGQQTPSDPKAIKEILKQKHSTAELIVGDDEDLQYSLSPCCSPIHGDDIFGYVTAGQGIKVHRTTCPNAVNLLASHGDRIIKAVWGDDTQKRYEIDLDVTGTDRMGIINDITHIVTTEQKMNITSMNIGTEMGLFRGKIGLLVQNKQQADKIIARFLEIEGVVKVSRSENKAAAEDEGDED
jgi:GTP pyrophosphokinase